MPYTTPVTDRTYVDVASGTAKGYFNVGDWVRIYDNTLYINQLVPAVLGLAAPAFTTIATPSTGSFPTVTTFNTLLEGIDNVRLVIEGVGVTITGLDEIYHSWEAGQFKPAPDYRDANDWEQSIALMYAFFNRNYRLPRTGIAACGASLTWNNRFRR